MPAKEQTTDSAAAIEAAALPVDPANDPILTDENAGQGGSYVIDPTTGLRTLAQRSQPKSAQE